MFDEIVAMKARVFFTSPYATEVDVVLNSEWRFGYLCCGGEMFVNVVRAPMEGVSGVESLPGASLVWLLSW